MGLSQQAPIDMPQVMEKGFVVTQVDSLINWARSGSM